MTRVGMSKSKEWKQERPKWCPYAGCIFTRRAMDNMCGGKLPKPLEHHGGMNTHRFCIRDMDDGSSIDYEVNAVDLDWFRWIFDALDGKKTSGLSNR